MAEKTIDAYIEKHPDWRGEAMRSVHALILETVPGIKSSIKWAQPVYESGGPMIFIKGASKHISVGFWRGAELADPQGLFDGDGDRMRHLKLKSAVLPRAQLVAWIQEAVSLNALNGDPTKGS